MQTKKQKQMSRSGLLFMFLKGSKRYYVLAMAASLMVSLTEMITPQFIRLTVDSVIGSEPLSVPAPIAAAVEAVGGVAALKSNLFLIAAGVVLVALFTGVFRYINMVSITKAAETFTCRIRNLLFAHIQRLPFAWHMKNRSGWPVSIVIIAEARMCHRTSASIERSAISYVKRYSQFIWKPRFHR